MCICMGEKIFVLGFLALGELCGDCCNYCAGSGLQQQQQQQLLFIALDLIF